MAKLSNSKSIYLINGLDLHKYLMNQDHSTHLWIDLADI